MWDDAVEVSEECTQSSELKANPESNKQVGTYSAHMIKKLEFYWLFY